MIKKEKFLNGTTVFLRTAEHRLQILYDRQTHRLPENEDEFAPLANRLGVCEQANAATKLRGHLEKATRLNRKDSLDHLLHDAFPGETLTRSRR